MALQWNDVRVNFNDTNSAMANAQSGISKVGTVFGELRKSILDEEQRAVENAYKQKVFDENVRQFGLQYALNQDKLAEQIRSNKANEANTIRGQDLNYKSTIRGQDLNYKSSMASIGAQNARLNFERSKWNALQSEKEKDKQTLASIANNLYNSRNDLNKEIENTQNLLNQEVDPTKKSMLESKLNILNQERTGMSATSLDNQYRILAAKNGINVKETPFTPEAALEQNRLATAIKSNKEAREKEEQSTIDATKTIKGLNLTSGQQDLAFKVIQKAKELYPDIPENIIANTLAKTPIDNAWLDWSGKNAFDYDLRTNNTLQDFINGRDLDTNLFNQSLANESIKYMRNNRKK